MKEYVLAKRYAKAIYEVILDKNIDSKKLIDYFIDFYNISLSTKLMDVFNNPNITYEQKEKVIEKIVYKNNYKEILKYILKKNRMDILKQINEEIEKIYISENNILVVNAYFADEISTDQKNRLVEKLEKKYKKKIELIVNIDKSIIGGAILKINGDIIDGSYKNQLKEITKIF